MKYLKLANQVYNFHKLCQKNMATFSEDLEPSEEFNKMVAAIEPFIVTVRSDGTYSKDKPEGDQIHIAMVDSVVFPGIFNDEQALLVRIANFIDEWKVKVNKQTTRTGICKSATDFKSYVAELMYASGFNADNYNLEVVSPDSSVKNIRYPNSNFNRWVKVTKK